MKEKIKKLRNWLILKLGGTTEDVLNNKLAYMFMSGQHSILNSVILYMDSINGTQADDWCKDVYNTITEERDRLHNILFPEGAKTEKEVD